MPKTIEQRLTSLEKTISHFLFGKSPARKTPAKRAPRKAVTKSKTPKRKATAR